MRWSYGTKDHGGATLRFGVGGAGKRQESGIGGAVTGKKDGVVTLLSSNINLHD